MYVFFLSASPLRNLTHMHVQCGGGDVELYLGDEWTTEPRPEKYTLTCMETGRVSAFPCPPMLTLDLAACVDGYVQRGSVHVSHEQAADNAIWHVGVRAYDCSEVTVCLSAVEEAEVRERGSCPIVLTSLRISLRVQMRHSLGVWSVPIAASTCPRNAFSSTLHTASATTSNVPFAAKSSKRSDIPPLPSDVISQLTTHCVFRRSRAHTRTATSVYIRRLRLTATQPRPNTRTSSTRRSRAAVAWRQSSLTCISISKQCA